MKKIAIVIADLDIGGAQRVAINMAEAFSRQHEVSLLIFRDQHQHYASPVELINLDVPEAEGLIGKARGLAMRIAKLKMLFSQRPFDLVISMMETANFATAVARKDSYMSVHCNPRFTYEGLEHKLIRWLYPRTKQVVAVSKDIGEIYASDYALSNIRHIYNPLNIKALNKKKRIKHQNKRPYLLAVGRMNYVKRFDLLIEAYAQSSATDSHDLLIVGDGDERQSLEALIAKHGLTDQVRLEGQKDDVYPYYAGAECYVMSSRSEAFPMVLIEALALQCPVLSTDCPSGPREIIQPDINGLLVDNENVQALADGINAMLADPEKLKQYRNNALKSIEHLSYDAIVKQWLTMDQDLSVDLSAVAELSAEHPAK